MHHQSWRTPPMHPNNKHPQATSPRSSPLQEESFHTRQTAELRDKRRERVLDYQAYVLAKRHPADATIGTINAGLMNLALHLEDVVQATLANSPPTLET